MSSAQSDTSNRAIAIWLLVCCALIFCMVVLGGVTRLTRSGLSIVEWDPIMGVVPPLSERQWEASFDKYKQYPEYRQVNRGMSLDEFKSIFWFEYSHRLLGRLIGVVFLVPLLYFLVTGRIKRSLTPKLAAMFVLGGLQGLLGWFMVQSGLVDRPSVSQYRLTAHLVFALAIYAYIFWVAMDLLLPPRHGPAAAETGVRRFGIAVTALVVLMIISGGFVAGTKAGHVFNTFPLMNGRWIPAGIMALDPWVRNFFENVATVQFDHRLLALVLAIVVPVFWLHARRRLRDRPARLGVHLLLAMLVVQLGLGIATLLLVVPVPLAAAHQAGALVLLTVALFVNHRLNAARTSTQPTAGAVLATGP